MSSEAGTVRGGERFIRGNRSSSDFVGVDSQDRSRFVGQINAQNQLAELDTAVSTTPRVDRTTQINSPLKSHSANSLREPLLQVGFEIAPESTARLVAQAQTRVERTLSERFGSRFEVSVVGRTAILRGVVAAAEDSRLAEAMALLEPGISKVQNELTLGESRAPPAAQDSGARSERLP